MNLNEFNRLIEEIKILSSELRISNEIIDFPYQPLKEPMIPQWKEKAQNELKSFKSEFLDNLIKSANEITEAHSALEELQNELYKKVQDHLTPLFSKRDEIGLKLALPYIKEIKKGLYLLPDDNKMEINHIWLEEGKRGLFLVLYGYKYNGNIKNKNRSQAYIFIDKPAK